MVLPHVSFMIHKIQYTTLYFTWFNFVPDLRKVYLKFSSIEKPSKTDVSLSQFVIQLSSYHMLLCYSSQLFRNIPYFLEQFPGLNYLT